VLSGLNPTKMVRQFGMVDDYDLEPTRSIYDYPLETLSHVPNVNNGCGGTGTEFCWKGLLPNGGTSVGGIGDVFFTDGSIRGWVLVLMYTILVVPSPGVVVGSQVECLLRRCQRFSWL
jgi:hypothetical protein